MFQPVSQRAARRGAIVLLVAALVLSTSACLSKYHTVGVGATGGESVSAPQWYALWGTVPLGGPPDSHALVGKRANYTVWTGMTTWDVLLNFLTAPVGFCRASLFVEF
ncbi:MAG: hypothetical protein JXQ29_16010 [Planctomycetes bacterium]|nr:hypothetical protein [Planctomycetota bacterium]